MDEREFYILLKRGLTIMANDPSAGAVQRRGMRVMVEALDRRISVLPAPQDDHPIEKKTPPTRQNKTPVLQSN